MEIWVLDLSNDRSVALTDHPAYDADPAWSPNGEEIAFVSTRGGELEIWVVTAKGGTLRRWMQAGDAGLESMKDPAWGRGVDKP